jgi:hypothetical protein
MIIMNPLIFQVLQQTLVVQVSDHGLLEVRQLQVLKLNWIIKKFGTSIH